MARKAKQKGIQVPGGWVSAEFRSSTIVAAISELSPNHQMAPQDLVVRDDQDIEVYRKGPIYTQVDLNAEVESVVAEITQEGMVEFLRQRQTDLGQTDGQPGPISEGPSPDPLATYVQAEIKSIFYRGHQDND